MNEERHWNKQAPTYNEEIFDVFKSDRKKVLPKYFKKYANKTKTAIDFGCGNGKAFGLIAPNFKSVVAVDISQNLIDQAKKTKYKNIQFKTLDLAKRKLDLPATDFAFCCNVAILRDVKMDHAIIRNVLHSLKKGGAAIFVIPSFESASFSAWNMIEWQRRDGVKVSDIPQAELNFHGLKKKHLQRGILKLEENPTKHYTCAEIYSLMHSDKFAIQTIERVEYTWANEFANPPKWMGEPYPWDWLVEVKRVK